MSARTLKVLMAFLFLAWVGAPLPAQEGGGGGAVTRANLDLPFRARGVDEGPVESPTVVIFYNQQYEGDGIFFCCDRSGSMSEAGKYQKLKAEVIKNIVKFTEQVQFGIVLFDLNVMKFPPSGRPAVGNPGMKAAAQSWVMASSPGHGTCTKPALKTSLTFANQSSARRKLIIYLSDGFQTCNDADPAVYGAECLAEVTQMNGQRVRINTICIGPQGQVDEDWMRRLASQNGGQFARITQ